MDAVGDEVGGRLEPGEEQQAAQRDELVAAQPVAVLLDAHQGGQQPIGIETVRMVEQVVEVLRQLAGPAVAGLVDGVVAEQADVEPRGDEPGPGDEAVAVFAGQAEELGDHRDGEREGELGDQVRGSLVLELGDRLIGQLLHAVSQRVHRSRREAARHEPSEPGVVRRVGEEERAVHQAS